MITRRWCAALVVAALLSGCASVATPAADRRSRGDLVVVRVEGGSGTPSPGWRHPTPPPPSAAPTVPVTTVTSTSPVRLPRPLPERIVRRYLWADSEGFSHSDSWTFALYRGVTPRGALRALSAGVAASRVESASRAQSDAGRRPYRPSGPLYLALLARRIGGWTMVMSDYGTTISDSSTVKRLSAGGAAVAFYGDVAANYEFLYARGGRLLRDFDPFDYNDFTSGQHPLAQENGIRFDSEKAIYPLARSFLLMQRLTGIRLRESDFESARFGLGVVVKD